MTTSADSNSQADRESRCRTRPLMCFSNVVGTTLSVAAGVSVWLGVVPDTGGMGGFYFPIMCGTVFAITFGFQAEPGWVAAASVAPQLLFVMFAPPGDNDGLQLLWFPFLLFVLFVLMIPAALGRSFRRRILPIDTPD